MGNLWVLGLGSPHGDDQVGWRVVERLAAQRNVLASLAKLTSPLDLLDYCQADRPVWLVDACCSGSPPGTVHRLCWPVAPIARFRARSSHGVGLWEALEMAGALGRLPWRTVIYAIEASEGATVGDLDTAVARRVSAVAAAIAAEVASARILPRNGN